MAEVVEAAGLYEGKAEEAAKGESALVCLWLDAITLASKEEEAWRDRARKTVEIYRDEKERSQRRYNILYANVQTLTPALYNSTPVPDVRPRFNSADPSAKIASRVLEKALSYCVDEYDFDAETAAVVQDMALPGRGVARIRYEPMLGPDGMVAYQRVLCEHVPWAQFRRGPGRMWRDVPWIAFELFLTRDELRRLSPELAEKVNLDASVTGYDKDKDASPPKEVFQRACVWEIWDKEGREVLFLAPSYKDAFLRREPDPLSLTGFFPVPRPLYAIETTDSLVPISEYTTYRDQAEELDRVTRRITSLVMVCKWRGIYAATEQGSGWLTQLKDADDGDLVPATDFMSLTVQGGGIDKAIWLMPIKEIAEVLTALYAQREQIKQVIFEITGTADIMRGSTVASETATAQQLKAQWGSLRVQRRQAEVQRIVRDLFRMKAEIIATQFSVQQLTLMTEEEITPQVEVLLRQDVLRSYRIDVETDSTIRADLTRAQENMAAFVQGTAQYITAVGPAVQAGQMPPDVAAEIYTAFARTFKLGKQAEDALARMGQQVQQPQPARPDPEAQKAEAEQAKTTAELQVFQAKAQTDQAAQAADLQNRQAIAGLDLQTKQQDAAMKAGLAQLQVQIDMEKLELEREKIAMERQRLRMGIAADQAKAAIDLGAAEAKAKIAAQKPEAKTAT